MIKAKSWRVITFTITGIVMLTGAIVLALPRVYVNIGLLALLHGNDELTRNSIGQAYATMPDNRTLLVMYTDRLREQGHFSETMSTLTGFSVRHPHDQSISLSLIESAARSGAIETAIERLRKLTDWSVLSPQTSAVLADEAMKSDSEFTVAQAVTLTAMALNWTEDLNKLAPVIQAIRDGLPHEDASAMQDAIHWRAFSVIHSNAINFQSTGSTPDDQTASVSIPGYGNVEVRLGPDLAVNGGFEQVDQLSVMPLSWRLAAWKDTRLFTPMSYVLGSDRDSHTGQSSLRMVMTSQEPQTGELEESRVGMWHPPVHLDPNSTYIISFVYKATNDIVRVFTTEETDKFIPEMWLPRTSEKWHHAEIIATNKSSNPLTIQPLVRVWGKGTAQFDDFSIRKVIRPTEHMLDNFVLSVEPLDK